MNHSDNRFIRTQMLLGEQAINRLAACKVAVFGLGGVGGYAVEALARGGVGSLELVDNDTVSLSNINRQILALDDTVGEYKTDVAARRVALINPDCALTLKRVFVLPETVKEFDFSDYDYVIDAIDTVSGKLAIAEECYKCGTPVISAMGTGNKLDPTLLEVADVFSTSVCPLARVMRRELKKRGIPSLKVVYSKEEPVRPMSGESEEGGAQHSVPCSVSFVPPVAGMIAAGEVIKYLAAKDK